MKTRKPSSPIKSSTQEFVEIEAVKDDILLLKDNSACIIMSSGTTNFGLLSQEEQNSMIYAYASLLNSLSFPIEILILSKRMDISSYLDYLDAKIRTQINPIINKQLLSYKEFIKTIIKKNVILEKKFFFIIPFSVLEIGVGAATGSKYTKDYVITRAKTSLYPKRDHLLRLLKKIGLGGRVLFGQEIAELFYNLYNPSPTGRKLAPLESYTDVISTNADTISNQRQKTPIVPILKKQI